MSRRGDTCALTMISADIALYCAQSQYVLRRKHAGVHRWLEKEDVYTVKGSADISLSGGGERGPTREKQERENATSHCCHSIFDTPTETGCCPSFHNMSSREASPSSVSGFDLDTIDESTVTDTTLKNLLRREIELQLQIDALQTEISQIEESTAAGKNNKNDEELDPQGKCHIYTSSSVRWWIHTFSSRP